VWSRGSGSVYFCQVVVRSHHKGLENSGIERDIIFGEPIALMTFSRQWGADQVAFLHERQPTLARLFVALFATNELWEPFIRHLGLSFARDDSTTFGGR
jgi:hypothetical protein